MIEILKCPFKKKAKKGWLGYTSVLVIYDEDENVFDDPCDDLCERYA